MIENVIDQNSDSSLAALMAVFDLASEEDYEPRVQKVETLYDIYDLDMEHTLETGTTLKSREHAKRGLSAQRRSLLKNSS